MYKVVVILILFLISITLFSQNHPISYYDIQKSARANKPILTKYQKWINESWQDSLIYEYSYFTDSTVVIKKALDTQTQQIEIEGKLTIFKNEDDNVIKELWQIFDSGWKNSYQYLYAYDGDKIISSVYEEWQDNNWLIIYQGYYTYDDNDNCILELWKVWINNNLVNSHQYTYEYDNLSNLTSVLYQFWDENGNLINSYKKTYLYSDTLATEYKYEKWENDEWQNVFKYNYQYDENNRFQRTDYYQWQNNDWVNTLFASYSYENDDISEELWKYSYNGIDFNYSRNIFFYENANSNEYTIIDNQMPPYNYPNPFNPFTTIYFNLSENEKALKVNIFNLKGECIKSFNIKNTDKIPWDGKNKNGTNVSSGVYFYKIFTSNKTKTGKMLLLK